MLRRTMLRPRDRLGEWLEGDRQYQREMLLALLAYAAVLVPVTIVMDSYERVNYFRKGHVKASGRSLQVRSG